MASLPVYKYQPLDTSQGEIRLITLHPGKPGDDLYITISHEALVPASDIQSSRLTLSELRQTLPKRWHAEQAVDGRYFFWEDSASRPISWNHPDGTMDPQKYTQAGYTRPLATTQFEALSYTWGSDADIHVIYVSTNGTIDFGAAEFLRRVQSVVFWLLSRSCSRRNSHRLTRGLLQLWAHSYLSLCVPIC